MASSFHIVEHVANGQHIRNYPRSTLNSQNAIHRLAIKQYIPKSNPNPQPGDLTIIGAHANAFPKELYEPLWEHLLQLSEAHGIQIRSIWIADSAWQGMSSVLNESQLGNDPSWNDHSLDLLQIINQFREDMPRPIVGIGHSMGGAQLAKLGSIHNRLFETLCLIDPVLVPSMTAEAGKIHPAAFSSVRRDTWPSRQEAASSFAKSPMFKAWDPNVLELYIKHGLRDLPTPLYSEEKGRGGVTLTTTKHQEVTSFARPALKYAPDTKLSRHVTHPDLDDSDSNPYPSDQFYRPEPLSAMSWLPTLRPSVLYISCENSQFNTPEAHESKMSLTGTAVGGSGGHKHGRVDDIVMKGAGHLVPMEDPKGVAELLVKWIAKEMERYKRDEEIADAEWANLPAEQKNQIPIKLYEAFVGSLPKKVRKAVVGPAKL